MHFLTALSMDTRLKQHPVKARRNQSRGVVNKNSIITYEYIILRAEKGRESERALLPFRCSWVTGSTTCNTND